ncbi:MAG TPA: PRC-barrel domain-containing protein [Steroidobacteraceae bacterium]|nr:PRC-barrel domain-containing protein [Steroidobacteraceae bacterium]
MDERFMRATGATVLGLVLAGVAIGQEAPTRVVAGAKVLSPAGESLGTVKNVVLSPTGHAPEYVLIATPLGKTAVPYPTILALSRDGRIVLNASRLEHSPSVTDQELVDHGDPAWKKQADQYWNTPY